MLRQLGVGSAAALVISNMVGTGIFTTTGYLAGDLGSPTLVLLIWLVGAVCALAGAFCYSELGVNFPRSGGEYVYLTEAYGPTWGFLSGWVSFFAGFSAPIAAAALAFAGYLRYFWPSLPAELMAAGLIAGFTVLNLFGVARVARVQNVLTSLKIIIVLAFIGLGLTVGTGNWGHFTQDAVRTSTRSLPEQFAVSLFFIYAGYSGWNAATYVAEEIKDPGRTLPRALAWGTALVALMYVGLNVVFIYGAPLESMKGELAVGSLAAKALFGPSVAGIFSLLMALSLMSTVNAMVTIGPRVYYAMARNNAFFAVAGRLHPRWRTPVAAILAQGVCAMLMTATPFPQLFFYIGFTLNFFAVMAVLSLLVLRRRPEWTRLPVVSFAWPLMPAFFALVGLWMTYFGMTLNTRASLAAVLTILVGAVVYRLRLRSAALPA